MSAILAGDFAPNTASTDELFPHNISRRSPNFSVESLAAEMPTSASPRSSFPASSSPRGAITDENGHPAQMAQNPSRTSRFRKWLMQRVNRKLQVVEVKQAGKALSQRTGPSSLRTVLTVSGAFCVGFMLISSGVILLATEHNRQYEAFRITGGVFVAIGVILWLLCLYMQKKNFLKNVERLDKELFAHE